MENIKLPYIEKISTKFLDEQMNIEHMFIVNKKRYIIIKTELQKKIPMVIIICLL